ETSPHPCQRSFLRGQSMRKALGFALAAFLVTPAMAGGSSQVTQIRQFFMNTGSQPTATGRLLFVQNPAQSQIKIQVNRLTPGVYDVILNGAVVDQLVVTSKGKGIL